MTLGKAHSVDGVPIRLTEERWEHILDDHPEISASDFDLLLDALEHPDYILRGQTGTLIAVRALGKSSYLHVIYRKLSKNDGFVITAGIRPRIDRKKIVWRR